MDTTPSTSPLPELSEDSVRQLRTLREGDQQTFFAYVKSLRSNKWPLRAIATPLGVSRTAVSNWESAVHNTTPLPATERLPEVLPKQVKPVYTKYQLTEDQRSELKDLAHEASKVRRFTDPHAKSRQDAKKLEDLLRFYTSSGASLGQLAKACEVSRSSIAQRLRKPVE
jgi:transcriptional regulator with XRE-family HTH domain